MEQDCGLDMHEDWTSRAHMFVLLIHPTLRLSTIELPLSASETLSALRTGTCDVRNKFHTELAPSTVDRKSRDAASRSLHPHGHVLPR